MLVAEAGGAETLGKEQCAGGGQQRGDPIARHIAGSQGGLAAVIDDFQAVGVDGDVLGGGSEGHHYGNRDQPGQVFLRIAEAHANQAKNDQHLGQHQPGAASPQLAEYGQAPLVEQRRPNPLKGIGEADQARVANGFASDTGFTQPDGQR